MVVLHELGVGVNDSAESLRAEEAKGTVAAIAHLKKRGPFWVAGS
jgi:hypothetical protein